MIIMPNVGASVGACYPGTGYYGRKKPVPPILEGRFIDIYDPLGEPVRGDAPLFVQGSIGAGHGAAFGLTESRTTKMTWSEVGDYLDRGIAGWQQILGL